jgi:phosphatidylserine/phosphatidylglycerophosphate/cardiolipin synthase-like enzyme
MTIVDDQIATIGSVNFSSRSWTHDSELMVLFGGTGGTVPINEGEGDDNVARRVRCMRWMRHLGETSGAISRWPDALEPWKRLPSDGARVRPWTPTVNLLRQPERIGGLIDPAGTNLMLSEYLLAYSAVLDPG